MGDFYETFDDDAVLAAKELEITLTSRSMGKGLRVPLAGVPVHALDNYLSRLIKKGHKVAICEQISDPAPPRGLVDRDVVRVVTPGTVLRISAAGPEDQQLPGRRLSNTKVGPDWPMWTSPPESSSATELPLNELPLELERIEAAEVLVPDSDDFRRSGPMQQVTMATVSSYELSPS